MARKKDRARALVLRKRGLSYSQIKELTGVSKSTLSGWLADYPLSEEQIHRLRDNNSTRIERCRNTKLLKKKARLCRVYQRTKNGIGALSDREIMIAGLFLYWGEGFKTSPATTGIANTDPSMLRFYILWLGVIQAPVEKITLKIQIYSDMSKKKEEYYWRKVLCLPKQCQVKMYVKESNLSNINYKNGFGHGTCNVLIYNRDLKEYVDAALNYLRNEIS